MDHAALAYMYYDGVRSMLTSSLALPLRLARSPPIDQPAILSFQLLAFHFYDILNGVGHEWSLVLRQLQIYTYPTIFRQKESAKMPIFALFSVG